MLMAGAFAPVRRSVNVGCHRMGSTEIDGATEVTRLPTLAHALVEDMVVLCYTHRNGPSDRDWAAWLERLAIDDFDKLLVSSLVDSGPNILQRRVVGEYWKGTTRSRLRIARLAISPLARGEFTALSWLLSDLTMRVFAPADLPEALAWLGTSVVPSTASLVLSRLATERPAGMPSDDGRLAG
jgi:hypothetical protein